jgi:hypothetical protein
MVLTELSVNESKIMWLRLQLLWSENTAFQYLSTFFAVGTITVIVKLI